MRCPWLDGRCERRSDDTPCTYSLHNRFVSSHLSLHCVPAPRATGPAQRQFTTLDSPDLRNHTQTPAPATDPSPPSTDHAPPPCRTRASPPRSVQISPDHSVLFTLPLNHTTQDKHTLNFTTNPVSHSFSLFTSVKSSGVSSGRPPRGFSTSKCACSSYSARTTSHPVSPPFSHSSHPQKKKEEKNQNSSETNERRREEKEEKHKLTRPRPPPLLPRTHTLLELETCNPRHPLGCISDLAHGNGDTQRQKNTPPN